VFSRGGLGPGNVIQSYGKPVALQYPTLKKYGGAFVTGTLRATVTAQDENSVTFLLEVSTRHQGTGGNIYGVAYGAQAQTLVVPRNGELKVNISGFALGRHVDYTASLGTRRPNSWKEEMHNQPFPVAVRALEYLEATAPPEGLPWWGYIESIARASAWVTRHGWAEDKAVRFSRHIGSVDAIGVLFPDNEVVTVDDFEAGDFLATDWLPVPSAQERWEMRYPLVDITDMQVGCTGTAYPFIVPRIDFPVIARGEGRETRLELLAGIGDNPWQVIEGDGGQTSIFIRGGGDTEEPLRLAFEGTAGGEFWVPNWDTDELVRALLFFSDSIPRLDFGGG